jgi:hypothetical protein
MFGNRQNNNSSATGTNTNNNDNKNLENTEKNKSNINPDRTVKVISKTLLDSKIIVVYKKIKSQNNRLRDVFNIYTFKNNECLMPERDAILFWIDRVEVVGLKNDIKIVTEDEEFEYDYKASRNLYRIEVEMPENSEQRDSNI